MDKLLNSAEISNPEVSKSNDLLLLLNEKFITKKEFDWSKI